MQKKQKEINGQQPTKVADIQLQSVKATGPIKRIAHTKYLTYTNKKLIASKYIIIKSEHIV